jgi:uncharacterized protein YndB with AHSA1/START domain
MSDRGSIKPKFVYVTYIRTTPEKLWHALTDPETMKQYWFGVHGESEWKAGASWRLVFADGKVADTGEIIEAKPPERLVIHWRNEFKPELKAEGFTRCTMTIEPVTGAVKLMVVHELEQDGPGKVIEAVSAGWPKVLSNLKSLLENGTVTLTVAYESRDTK